MDRERLDARLAEAFDGGPQERRVVVRQAGDLVDAGRYAEIHATDLDEETVIDNLADAPESGVIERWNWWIGALDLAHGGFERFSVRVVPDDEP